MGIKTVPQPPYCPDLALCDFWLFTKLKEKHRGCRYETIEAMKEAVTKDIDTLTQEDLRGAFQRLLKRYNKCIAAGAAKMCPYEKSLITYLIFLVCLRTSQLILSISKPLKKKVIFGFEKVRKICFLIGNLGFLTLLKDFRIAC